MDAAAARAAHSHSAGAKWPAKKGQKAELESARSNDHPAALRDPEVTTRPQQHGVRLRLGVPPHPEMATPAPAGPDDGHKLMVAQGGRGTMAAVTWRVELDQQPFIDTEQHTLAGSMWAHGICCDRTGGFFTAEEEEEFARQLIIATMQVGRWVGR